MSDREDLVAEFELNSVELEAEFELNSVELEAEFTINTTPDKVSQIENDLNFQTDIQVQEAIQAESNIINTRIDNEVERLEEELAKDLANKQDVLTAGENIQIENNVISATNTTYTAGEGISIVDNVISNTQKSGEWGNIEGDITNQTDLIDLIDTKIDIEATARENNDLLLQNGINTLNDDLTAEISNRGAADGILQNNIDTLSETVTSNYNTLDGKIDTHIADKTNPHEVTKSQIGLGNVDNTSDLDKPISTATQTALDDKQNTINDLSEIRLNASNGQSAYNTIKTFGDIVTYDASSFATNLQGQKADTALQPNDDISKLNNDAGYITSADVPTVNNSTITFQKNNITVGDINLNQANNETINFDIPTTASDVGALPDSTTIGNGTLTIQKNGTTIDTFGANDTGNTTVNITVPTDTGDLTNNAGYIKDINRTDVTTALGYTPYDSTNPDGYTDNVGTVTSVNNTQPDTNGNVTISIPAAQVNSDWNASSGVAQILNKPTLSTVATSGSYNDLSDKPTIPTVGNGTITINQGGVQKGTFTTNQSGNTTIDLDSGGSDIEVDDELSTISENPVQNKVITQALADSTDVFWAEYGVTAYNDIKDALDANKIVVCNVTELVSGIPFVYTYRASRIGKDTTYIPNNAITFDCMFGVVNQILVCDTSSNWTSHNYRFAQEANVPTESTVSGWGFTKNIGTVTSVNNVAPVNGNVTITIPEQVQSDWSETNTTSKAYIQNKPTIPAEQVNSDWNATSGKAQILNKPTIPTVYITQTYHNGSSWYRVWSDGFIEQGGSVSASSSALNVSISFLKNFSSTNYVIVASSVSPTSYSSSSNNATKNYVMGWASTLCLKVQSGISRCRTNNGSYSWYACGY